VWDAFDLGSRYAFAVGAAVAAVGIVVGIVTLTAAGFRISFMVTQAALQMAEFFCPIVEALPTSMASLQGLMPSVCVAAYAAAGIAGSNPFRTGLTAFRLGLAKATVPFVLAYSPVMLIMVDGFTWGDFLFTTISCAIGVLVLGIGMTGFAFTQVGLGAQATLVISALLMISPNIA